MPARAISSRWRRVIVPVVIGAALLIRLGFVASQPDFRPSADAADFDRIAVSLATDGRYPPSQIAPSGGPSAFRPPAYPYVLAAAYRVTGTADSTARYDVARVLGAVLGTGVAVLVGLLAWMLWDGVAALVALAAAAVYPPLITESVAMLSEGLFTLCVLGAVACALRARQREHWLRWAILAGATTGVAALARTNGLVVAPIVLAGVWSGAVRGRSLRAVGAAAALVVVSVTPWIVRNASAFHQLVPVSTQAGFTLAGTYNADARADRVRPGAWRIPTMAPYGRLRVPGPDEAALEDRFRSTAVRYATQHPAYIAQVGLWNFERLFDLRGPDVEHPAAQETGVSFRVSDLDVYAFYVLGVLALLAACAGALRGTPIFVSLVPAAMVVSLIFVISYMRYRWPVDPFLILLVAGGCTAVLARRGVGETVPPGA